MVARSNLPAALSRHPWLTLVLIVALSHGISALNGFVFDDDLLLVNNSSVKNPGAFVGAVVGSLFEGEARGGAIVYFRPLVTTSHFLTHQVFGLQPLPYHLTNLFLHVLNAWMLAGILRLWFRIPLGPAVMAAALWAAHPIHTEAVAWISGRTDVLCATGIFGALLMLWPWMRHGRPSALMASLLFAAAALLAKELGVVLPALVAAALWVRWPALRRSPSARSRAAVAVALALALALGFVAWRSQALAGHEPSQAWPTHDMRTTLLTVPNMLMLYARLLLWPHPLTLNYTVTNFGVVTSPHETLFWLPLLGCAAIGLVALLLTLWRRPLGLALAWFWITLAPVSQVRPLNVLAAERYDHLPSVAFAAVAGLVLAWALSRRRARTVAIVGWLALLMVFCALSTSRALVWRDNLTLFTHAQAQDPGDAQKAMRLAEVLMGLDRPGEALEVLRRGDHSLPDPPVQLEMEGTALINMGRVEEGLALVDRAARWPSRRAHPHNILAMWAIHQGDLEAAEAHVREGLGREEGDTRSSILLAQIARLRGDLDEAILVIDETLRLNPDLRAAHVERAWIARAMGQPDEARRTLERARTLGSPTPEELMFGADLAMETGRWDDALRDLETLIERGEVSPGVLTDAGYALASLGRPREAMARWEEALAIDPSHEAAAHNLAALRATLESPRGQ